jgi:hypothetical protein
MPKRANLVDPATGLYVAPIANDGGAPDRNHPAVNQTFWQVDFHVTDSSGASTGCDPTATYDWKIDGSAAALGALPPLVGPPDPCEFTLHFDKLGTYDVTLTTTPLGGSPFDFTKSVTIQDWLIVSLGDSTGSGEGNPDVQGSHPTWQNTQCHRSSNAAVAIAARDVEQADPHNSVTFVHLACSGASIPIGLLNPYAGLDPSQGPPLASQVSQLAQIAGTRQIDALVLQAGANDLNFGDIVSNCVFSAKCANMLVSRKACPCPFGPVPFGIDGEIYLDAAFQQGILFWQTPTAGIHIIPDPLSQTTLDTVVSSNVPSLSNHLDLLATTLQQTFPISLAQNRVLVTEYFDPTRDATGAFCPDGSFPTPFGPSIVWTSQMSYLDAQWAAGAVVAPMNQRLLSAALAHGWQYIGGIANNYSGHGYCAGADRWVNLLSDSNARQGDNAGAMHPNLVGQAFTSAQIYTELAGTLGVVNRRVTSSLSSASTVGATEISISSISGFSISDSVSIGVTGTDAEVRRITGFGSLKLDKPLLLAHAAGEPVVRLANPLLDTSPPKTLASASATPNSAGWINQSPISVTLFAQDEAGGSGVLHTYYALDNGSCAPPSNGVTISPACQIGTSVTVSGEGRHTLYFFSVDAAGNFEAQQRSVVNIDATPPVTLASTNPPPNAAGWNNQANVTVTLAATDNLSGVARTEFNLDGAPWSAYSAPVVVTTEGKHVLQYRSIDKADNVETTHQLAVNIDRTAPEASLQFDASSSDIQVFGHDALSGTPSGAITPSSVTPAQWGKEDEDQDLGDADHRDADAPRIELRTYKIADAAGNTLSLVLKVHMTRHQLQANVVSLQYNGAAAISVGRNTERFDRALDDEQGGKLSKLEQQVRLGTGKDRQSAQAEFKARENITRIDVEMVGKPDVDVTKPGLVLLQTNTAQATLTISY